MAENITALEALKAKRQTALDELDKAYISERAKIEVEYQFALEDLTGHSAVSDPRWYGLYTGSDHGTAYPPP